MRFFLNSIVLLAFILQGLVPVGFMPVADSGKVAVVICSGTGGTKTVFVDRTQAPQDQEHQEEASTNCPFALAQLPFVYTPPFFDFIEAEISAVRYEDGHEATLSTAFINSYQSRAPPVSFL